MENWQRNHKSDLKFSDVLFVCLHLLNIYRSAANLLWNFVLSWAPSFLKNFVFVLFTFGRPVNKTFNPTILKTNLFRISFVGTLYLYLILRIQIQYFLKTKYQKLENHLRMMALLVTGDIFRINYQISIMFNDLLILI